MQYTGINPMLPPPLPQAIAAELSLTGECPAGQVAVRGRGGLFDGRCMDVSPMGVVVALSPSQFDRRFDDCFRTGADVRFPVFGGAVRADLVYSARGVVDRKEQILGVFQFRRGLTDDQCVALGLAVAAAVS